MTETSLSHQAESGYEPRPPQRLPSDLPARARGPRREQVSNQYVAVGVSTGARDSDTALLVPNSDDEITDIESTDAQHEARSTTREPLYEDIGSGRDNPNTQDKHTLLIN